MTPQPCEIVASKIASSSVIPVTPNTLLNILSSCSFSDLSPTNASGTLECIVEHGKSALASSIPPRGFFARPLTFEAKKGHGLHCAVDIGGLGVDCSDCVFLSGGEGEEREEGEEGEEEGDEGDEGDGDERQGKGV
ncbi:hypothetical protein EYC84_008594 [Monilinia fructicola]|uniref:Uncharacterized protein n=1 Tax=Monilinia fructicola TaxID=38448 RepID=A0A5M9JKE2_MONFR|nr:hypothetical protein EYC84_008594 [Monilinia fructicola]